VLLVVLRFLQGFAVGGEWGGAVLMVVEHGHRRGRGFYASLSQSGTAVGLLLSMGVFAVVSRLPEASFLTWGWRVPFLLGIVLMFVGFVIRMHVEESPLFTATRAAEPDRKKTLPLVEALRNSARSLFVILASRIAENSCSYILTVFLLTYATEQLGLARSSVLHAVMVASALGMFTIPALGALSDRLGRRWVYIGGATLMAVCAFPFFWLLETRELWAVYVVLIGGFSVCVAAMFAPQAAFFSELFPTNVRYSGASASYQLAAAFGGGIAPMIATQLLKLSGGESWSIAVYIIVLSVIGATVVFFAKETSKRELAQVAAFGADPREGAAELAKL
jgi:MFS family permease